MFWHIFKQFNGGDLQCSYLQRLFKTFNSWNIKIWAKFIRQKSKNRKMLLVEISAQGFASFSSSWSRHLLSSYKFINNLTPRYTTDPIPQLLQSWHSLCKQNAIGRIRTRTEKFHSRFYPYYLSEWNKLDSEVRLSSSIVTFKTKVLSKIPPSAPKLCLSST